MKHEPEGREAAAAEPFTPGKKPPAKVELLVIGGGPAGLGAAIEAARRGVDTLLVDENERAGGQLYKQIHKFFGSSEHHSGVRGFRIAETLLEEAREVGVRVLAGHRVVGVLRDGRVLVVGLFGENAASWPLAADRVVLAVGGRERSLPFPGWTLPGVMSAGAAQTFCNVHGVLPNDRVLMLGSGNVGLIVSYQLMQAGAELAGLVEIKESIGGYYVHAGKLSRARVPFFLSHRVVEARGEGRLEEVEIESIETGGRRSFSVDGLYLSVGLNPRTEIGRMLGCRLAYEGLLGGSFPLHDERMRSSIPHVYCAGDAAGIEEANSSLDEGRLAGIAVAEDLAKISPLAAQREEEAVQRRLEGLRSGRHGVERLRAKRRVVSSFFGSLELGDEEPARSRAGEPREANNQDPGAAAPETTPLEAARRYGHPVPIIDCPETIPCNPCVTVCPAGAVEMDGVCGLPRLDYERCTGCMLCAAACPGQAIFMLAVGAEEGSARITLPWELPAVPRRGAQVSLLGREGRQIGRGHIVSIRQPAVYDKTSLVTIEADEGIVPRVQSCAPEGADR